MRISPNHILFIINLITRIIGTFLLIFQETLEGIILPSTLVLHLKHYGKSITHVIWLSVII